MPKERLKITQPLCVTAKFMLDRGAGMAETAQLLKISTSTLQRIQAAGFDAMEYAKQLADRRAEDQRKREELKQAMKPRPEKLTDEKFKELMAMCHPEELQGQISMELPEAEKQPAEEQKKLYRFLAGQFDETQIAICDKLGKIYDMLEQILRAIRKE